MAADMNLPLLFSKYGTDNHCRAVLGHLRWPDGPRCLRCGSANVVPISTRALNRCRDCQYQFSATVGTIFNDSHLPLTKWFLATYLMVESKKSMSANQLKRTLDVSYKTAWYLCHRIRKAMEDANPEPLDGIIEVDATYIGGKKKGIGRGNYRPHKTAVIAAVKRGGPFKRSIVGAYHQISVKHMEKYLDEQAWRFDNRSNPYLFRDTLLKLIEAKAMPFSQLVEPATGAARR